MPGSLVFLDGSSVLRPVPNIVNVISLEGCLPISPNPRVRAVEVRVRVGVGVGVMIRVRVRVTSCVTS